MEKHGLPLLVHGEVTDPDVDVFDRERVFVERVLSRIVRDFPGLRIVRRAHHDARSGRSSSPRRRRTSARRSRRSTCLWSRNALLAGGVRPHFYCLPVLKREAHRLALVDAATGGNPKYFLGTDSAPHARHAKESACGCAGCYSAPLAIELYAEAFDAAGALDRLEAFASFHGADFYGLPRNAGTITLEREAWTVPAELSVRRRDGRAVCARREACAGASPAERVAA